MKKIPILVFLVTAVLFSLLACSSAVPKELSVDSASSGKEVTLAAGGTLTISLDSNPITGYSWNEYANVSDNTVIKQTDHEYQNPPRGSSGGKEVWTFKALKAGESTISMEYKNPDEPSTVPNLDFTMTVMIK